MRRAFGMTLDRVAALASLYQSMETRFCVETLIIPSAKLVSAVFAMARITGWSGQGILRIVNLRLLE